MDASFEFKKPLTDRCDIVSEDSTRAATESWRRVRPRMMPYEESFGEKITVG